MNRNRLCVGGFGWVAIICVLFFTALTCEAGTSVLIAGMEDNPRVSFAVRDLKDALTRSGCTVVQDDADLKINLAVEEVLLESQAFRIEKDAEQCIRVTGGDSAGLMYGVLDLAETLSLYGLDRVTDKTEKPYLDKRGLKMNIPLDGRNPAYSDAGTAAQMNIPVVWDLEFWKEHLDRLARNRYNAISLWNMHPFPSLVKVPDYPEAALHDVMRADFSEDEWKQFNKKFKLPGSNMVTPELEKRLSVVKKMTPEEKIRFWQEVMRYADQRGIEFYVITWNTFTWGATGKHGITQDAESDITKDYIRKSVTALFNTYPLLAGIGVTAGENMHKISKQDKEKWLWETYGLGVMDYLDKDPDRSIRFIHRYWWADLNEIVREFQPMIDRDVTFDISFKYAKARLYSGVNPPFSDDIFEQLPEGKRMWCNLRNDDIFIMRWADPDYVRNVIQHMPEKEKCPGFYMGADGYVFGKEFVCKHPDTAGKLEVDKHWLQYMLWGRLGYNPEMKNEHFERSLAARFPQADANRLFTAWQESSKIIPLMNRFYWNDWDFQWHVESCQSFHNNVKSNHTAQRFIERGKTMQGSGILNIRDYCKKKLEGTKSSEVTPLQIADQLDEWAASARKQLPSNEVHDQELKETMMDIKAMATLGHYYADKIRGAVNLCLYQQSHETSCQKEAIQSLQHALEHWEAYAALISTNYKPQLLARVGWIDMQELTKQAEEDVAFAKNAKAIEEAK